MRIAVSLEGEELDDPIDMDFGEAAHFMIVEVHGNNVEKVKVIESVKSYKKGHEDTSAAKQLEGEGIDGVISSAFDPASFRELTQRGIKVFVAEPGNAMYNLELVVQGDLKPAEDIDDIGYERKGGDKEETGYGEEESGYDEEDDADMPATDQDEETEERYSSNEDMD